MRCLAPCSGSGSPCLAIAADPGDPCLYRDTCVRAVRYQSPSCPSILGGLCRYLELGTADPGVPRKFAFLIAFAWLIGSVFIHRAARPTLRSLPELTQLATTLVDEEQYDDAIRLVEPHLELIAVASCRKSKIQLAHDRLKDFRARRPAVVRSVHTAARPGATPISRREPARLGGTAGSCPCEVRSRP